VLCNDKRNFDLKYFSSAFFQGPLALYIENDLMDFLTCEKMEDRILDFFNVNLKSTGKSILGYGSHEITEIFLFLRYSPIAMFILEGLSKFIFLLLIIFNGAVDQNSYVYNEKNYDKLSSNEKSKFSSNESIIVLFIISFLLYEVGLMEEKRWFISPEIIFRYSELEKKRWDKVKIHFLSTYGRFLT
jgi:hypothetical protein